jgi:hypothetical protein
MSYIPRRQLAGVGYESARWHSWMEGASGIPYDSNSEMLDTKRTGGRFHGKGHQRYTLVITEALSSRSLCFLCR